MTPKRYIAAGASAAWYIWEKIIIHLQESGFSS